MLISEMEARKMDKDKTVATEPVKNPETDSKMNANGQRLQGMGGDPTNVLIIGFVLLLLAISLINTFLLFNIGNSLQNQKPTFQNLGDSAIKLNGQIETALRESKPAKVSITSIVDTSCSDCFDVNSIIEQIKRTAITVVSENKLDVNSQKASELINKYKIYKIPTIIVSGEIDKAAGLKAVWGQLGSLEPDALILRNIVPPYRDLNQNRIVGRISIIYLVDSSCKECFKINSLKDSLAKAGIQISKEATVDISSDEGKAMTKNYNITIVPTIILSSDASAYSNLNQIWTSVGSVESDGSYVLRYAYPPYRNISSKAKNIVGLVKVTYIVDNSCADCYNVSLHNGILKNLGVFVSNESTFDISSATGKSLIKKYNITKVPTVIISKDAGVYSSLNSVWDQVGSVESDGSYIFRNIEAVAGWKYRNITAS